MSAPWLTITPTFEETTLRRPKSTGKPVQKIRGVLSIPAFSFTTIWSRSSKIVAQFNISLPGSVRLGSSVSIPGYDGSYLPCVRYRKNTTVYRYKLKSGVGEVLDRYSLYNNEQIKKNFCLEIWDVSGHTTISQTAFTINLPLLYSPATFEETQRTILAGNPVSTTLYLPYSVTLPLATGTDNAWIDNS